jgi:large subunit ribosomal protein L7Ae
MDDDRILHIVEIARNTGKVKIGTNEATKAIERGVAKLVVAAEDCQPKEIIMHLSPLCNEKKIPYAMVKSKQELGRAAGIDVPTAAIAIIQEGDSKKDIEELAKK